MMGAMNILARALGGAKRLVLVCGVLALVVGAFAYRFHSLAAPPKVLTTAAGAALAVGTPTPLLPRGVLYDRLIECMFSGDPGSGCISPFTRVELRAYSFGFRAPHPRKGVADAVPDSLCASLVAEDPALRGSSVSRIACRSAFEDAAYDVANTPSKADALGSHLPLRRAVVYASACRRALADGSHDGRYADAPRCNAAEFVVSVHQRRRPAFIPLFPCTRGNGLPAGNAAECALALDAGFSERRSQ